MLIQSLKSLNTKKKFQYSFINKKLKKNFKKRKFSGKLIIPNTNEYTKLKAKIKTLILRRISMMKICLLFIAYQSFLISAKNLL